MICLGLEEEFWEGCLVGVLPELRFKDEQESNRGNKEGKVFWAKSGAWEKPMAEEMSGSIWDGKNPM